MAKEKKDGKFLHCYVNSEIMERFEEYLKKSRLSKTAATELALEQFLDSEYKKQQNNIH